MTRAFVAFLIVGGLIGCSSTPDPIPDCDIPAPMEEVGQPVSVPEMPVEVSSDAESATFDFEGILQLERVRQAGKANKTIAEENAAALAARNVEVNELIECARYQNIWIQVHQEDLDMEKRDHFLDNWIHRGVIGLILIGIAL